MRYFIRTIQNKWEEVNQYVFTNRKFAVTDDSKVRYGEQYIIQNAADIEISGKVSVEELGRICRFLGVGIPNNSFTTPIVSEPETVKIIKGNSTRLHVIKTGESWILSKTELKVA